jgi:hypothetical protein
MEQSNWWMKGGHYICTGGHMSDLLIDAQLHFFQKLHDHRVVIKLPSKYHNTIHNSTLFFTYFFLFLYILFFILLLPTLAWNFLTYYCIFLNIEIVPKVDQLAKLITANGELFGLGYKYHIYYLSTSHKNSYFFGDNI